MQTEKETFIEQLKDIIDKAEDMLSEDTEGERSSDQGTSPQQGHTVVLEMGEVRTYFTKENIVAKFQRTCV